MPRDLPIGNGRLSIAFDRKGRVCDLFYPSLGNENHTEGNLCRFGVWVDGTFTWFPDGGWDDLRLSYEKDALVTHVAARHSSLNVEIEWWDCVDVREDIFVRKVVVSNLATAGNSAREVRLFFHYDLSIGASSYGDTAAYDPTRRCLVHYKGSRYFLFGGSVGGRAPHLDQYAVGIKGRDGAEGTWRDAEDGRLSGNPIQQGAVDATFALHGQTGEPFYSWLAAGMSLDEAARGVSVLLDEGVDQILQRTASYWRLWVRRDTRPYADLPPVVVDAYKRSLLAIRTQVDASGGIVASSDWELARGARDSYAYVWPRDGALIADAVDQAGYPELARGFFEFCERAMTPEGYLHHKYNPDGTPASSWHPHLVGGVQVLPIQEDETALVIWALWRHFERRFDVEFARRLYDTLVVPAAEFLLRLRDPATGLPLPSWDLWEERYGVHTFTVSSVIGALQGAALFARAFGDERRGGEFARGADAVRQAMERHLWGEVDGGRFARSLFSKPDSQAGSAQAGSLEGASLEAAGLLTAGLLTAGSQAAYEVDFTVDASLSGLFLLGAYGPKHPKVRACMEAVRQQLWVKTPIGGIARYQGDGYQRVVFEDDVPGNPWFVCTLWLAEWEIAVAEDLDQLGSARERLVWAAERALASGVLAEQLHPHTGAPISVSPLTWSHAGLVAAVDRYRMRWQELVRCSSCGRPFAEGLVRAV